MYTPFEGICLTDTFQLYENGQMEFEDKILKSNSERVNNQRKQPITVVVGNPPYSVGQKSANDNAQNQNYSKLEKKIADTYVALSRANLNKATYDSYIKAFRWASDRLDKNDGGVIAFVSNGAWIDNNGLDGFRKDIEQEFSSIYIFNLRGNCRTSGELRRKESGNVFGEGSRTPISITVLVKKPNKSGKAKILYHDIGDYLAREEKLKMISEFHDIGKMELVQLTPNEHGDWINQRNDMFGNWIPLESKKKYDIKSQNFFIVHSLGIATNKDYLLYDYSNNELIKKVNQMISFYNEQRLLFNSANNKKLDAKSFVTYDSNKINWTDLFLRDLEKNIEYKFCSSKITDSVYRPFCKQRFVYEKQFLQRTYQQLSIFPTLSHKNLVICLKGIGDKDFSCLISNCIPDLQFVFNGQCFPLYWYEVIEPQQGTLFGSDEQIIRHEAISDFILKRAQSKYGNKVQREDIFYYVYGILHSKSYRETFSADLKKMLPRIPLVSDFEKFWAFSKAGRDLAELHLNYENVEASKEVNVVSLERPLSALRATSPNYVGADLHDETPSLIAAETTAKFNANYNDNNSNNREDYAYYEVQQMKFPKKGEKSIIIYNKNITISNIPEKAYQYVVNGKSAIEWIMERYAITTDKKSGITNDPNDWSREHNKPRYIIDLLLSVINVSLKTVDIVDALPEVDWEKE